VKAHGSTRTQESRVRPDADGGLIKASRGGLTGIREKKRSVGHVTRGAGERGRGLKGKGSPYGVKRPLTESCRRAKASLFEKKKIEKFRLRREAANIEQKKERKTGHRLAESSPRKNKE